MEDLILYMWTNWSLYVFVNRQVAAEFIQLRSKQGKSSICGTGERISFKGTINVSK